MVCFSSCFGNAKSWKTRAWFCVCLRNMFLRSCIIIMTTSCQDTKASYKPTLQFVKNTSFQICLKRYSSTCICVTCAKLPVASFSHIPVNFTPFNHMSMDIKDMPMSLSCCHKIIVFNCLAMQYIIVCPLHAISTETVFDCLFMKIICIFGKPSVIITDQQSSFTSPLMERLTTVFGTQLQFIGKEHHGANLTERYIQSMNNIFEKYLEDTWKNWPSYLTPVCYAMNTFVSPTMGVQSL